MVRSASIARVSNLARAPLVPVVLRLERPLRRHPDIARLLGREGGELGAEAPEFGRGPCLAQSMRDTSVTTLLHWIRGGENGDA